MAMKFSSRGEAEEIKTNADKNRAEKPVIFEAMTDGYGLKVKFINIARWQ